MRHKTLFNDPRMRRASRVIKETLQLKLQSAQQSRKGLYLVSSLLYENPDTHNQLIEQVYTRKAVYGLRIENLRVLEYIQEAIQQKQRIIVTNSKAKAYLSIEKNQHQPATLTERTIDENISARELRNTAQVYLQNTLSSGRWKA